MSLLLIIGSVAGAVVLWPLLAAMIASPTRRRIVSLAFWCPFRDRAVSAELEVDETTLQATDVHSCSVFDPPERIPCHKRCRDLPMVGPAVRR